MDFLSRILVFREFLWKTFLKKFFQKSDYLLTFLASCRIIEMMKTKGFLTIYIVRAALIILTVLILIFIFSNALATGEVSSQQSYRVTVAVQEAVGVIAPTSPIATATGEDFDLLHACIRDLAHFSQYALLGATAFGAYLSFVKRGKWRFAFISPCFLLLTSILDEFSQSLTVGRAAQLTDIAIDSCGSMCGIAVAFMVYGIVMWIVSHRKRRGERV